MICKNCGNEILEGQKFCASCGTPVEPSPVQVQPVEPQPVPVQPVEPQPIPVQPVEPQPVPQPVYPVYSDPYQTNTSYNTPVTRKDGHIIAMVFGILAFIVIFIVAAEVVLVKSITKASENAIEMYQDSIDLDEYDLDEFDPDDYDLDDFDIDDLDLDDLDLDDYDFSDYGLDDIELDDYEYDWSEEEPDETDLSDSGDVYSEQYEYASVEFGADSYKIIPNGTVNDKTVILGKDLGGFLDYVDNTVLEPGRTINRDMFYDLVSVHIVDSSMYDGNEASLGYFIVSAATVANNFHDLDVSVKDVVIKNDNGSTYFYDVKAEGKDDVWSIDYGTGEVYLNDGKTLYSSEMLDSETMAVWMVAVNEYFGIEF